MLGSTQQMSILCSFCSYLGCVFNEMCLGPCYAKIGVYSGWNHHVKITKRICDTSMRRPRKLHHNVL